MKNGNGNSKRGGSFHPAAGLGVSIYPDIAWNDGAFAKLTRRFDLFDDMIIVTDYDDKGKTPTRSFVADPLSIVEALGRVSIDSGLLPDNVLFWQRREGQERLGVWLPPQVWRLRVEPTTRVNRVIPLPGLVFAGRGKSYGLWALADDNRPGLDTPLYNAPCPNVSENGVCTGNVEFPEAGAATIRAAVEAFFESGFNNHLDNGKSKKHPAGILALWKELHSDKAEVYPVEDLVPAGLTLKGVIGG
jgi:PRTRC genetic system protein B